MIEGKWDKRVIAFWVIVVLLFCLAYFADRVEAQGFALDCLPPLTDPILIPDHLMFPGLPAAYVPPYVMDALRQIPAGDSFWIPTPDYGYFKRPENIVTVLWIDELFVMGFAVEYSADTPSVLYLTVFDTYDPSTNANGEYFGVHPCAAVRVVFEDFKMALFGGMSEE